jgi:hypothetical protein
VRLLRSTRNGIEPRISVYLDDVEDDDKGEVAGMLRGLMCALEGWGAISGLTNDVMSREGPARVKRVVASVKLLKAGYRCSSGVR